MATVMGFGNGDDYLCRLDEHRGRVAGHFNDLIAEPGESDEAESEDDLQLWGDGLSAEALADLGYRRAEETLQQLQALQQSAKVVTLQPEGRARLEQFMPRLLQECTEADDPDLARCVAAPTSRCCWRIRRPCESW